MQANMHEAKSNLSQLADKAKAGETVVIAKAGKPYVDLVPHSPRKARKPGGYDIDMSKFNDVDEEVSASFLRPVDLSCTNFAQRYIGNHIILNASDTMLA